MCLYPKLIQNPKYKANKKNGGIIPTVSDPGLLYVPIGCQNCIECRKAKTREWMIRLLEDIKTHKNGKFYTLTFSNEQYSNIALGKDIKGKQIREPLKETGYHLDNQIATIAVKAFRERWRKEFKKSPRHWLVTELGTKRYEHLHLHGIIWHDKEIEIMDEYWGYGFTHKGQYNVRTGKYLNYVNGKTVNYITKYVSKMDLVHQKYKPIILTSPGIGNNYINTYDSKQNKFNPTGETNETYRTATGHKMALPIYWRNKIYNEDEKEVLWLRKQQSETRYILGQPVKNDYEYYKILETARIKNKELNYGDGTKNWNREQYEKHIRTIKQNLRIYQNKDPDNAKDFDYPSAWDMI